MALYTVSGAVKAESPVMISALLGWVDAASVATDAAKHIAGSGPVIAHFDGDELFDYRSNRPILDIVDGAMAGVTWPEITVREATLGGRDLLVMTGSEPDMRWHAFSSSVVELAQEFNVSLHVTLGAVPAAVPHTRATPMLTTASREGLISDISQLPPTMRVPSAAISIVDRELGKAGLDTVGFFAQVPHYVAGPYHDGIMSLVGRVASQLGAEVSLDELRQQAATERAQLDEIVEGRPDAKEYVARLESVSEEENIPSGDELADEFQRYFSQQDPGGGPFSGGSPGTDPFDS
jgi:proteasome assembly chaperone (PAC2) family protein